MGLLRFLLALCVVVHHTPKAGISFMSGGIAVQAFYIVSGYFIAMVLSGKYRSLRTFYVNRALRLYPIYLTVLALSAAEMYFSGANLYAKSRFFPVLTDPLAVFSIVFSNLTMIGQEWLVWFDAVRGTGSLVLDVAATEAKGRIDAWKFLLVPQAWSLSLELAFYAIAPFVVKRRLWVIALIAAASLGVRICWEITGVDYNLWVRRMFASELCLFLLGVMAFRLTPAFVAFAGEARARIIGFSSLAALVLLIGFHARLFGVSAEGRAVLFFGLAFALPFIHHALGRSSIDRRIGDLSYPIYIVHVLVISTIKWLAPAEMSVWLSVSGTLAAAGALYLVIDRPVDALRQKLAARAEAAS